MVQFASKEHDKGRRFNDTGSVLCEHRAAGTSKKVDPIHFISHHGAASDSTLVESQGKYMLVDAGNRMHLLAGITPLKTIVTMVTLLFPIFAASV